MSAAGKELKEGYAWTAKAQWKRKPVSCPLSLTITLYFKDKRKRDWDNFHKILMDSMNGIVFEDDSQIGRATVIKRFNERDGRAEVMVEEFHETDF